MSYLDFDYYKDCIPGVYSTPFVSIAVLASDDGKYVMIGDKLQKYNIKEGKWVKS
jgi:hypothetical protein